MLSLCKLQNIQILILLVALEQKQAQFEKMAQEVGNIRIPDKVNMKKINPNQYFLQDESPFSEFYQNQQLPVTLWVEINTEAFSPFLGIVL